MLKGTIALYAMVLNFETNLFHCKAALCGHQPGIFSYASSVAWQFTVESSHPAEFTLFSAICSILTPSAHSPSCPDPQFMTASAGFALCFAATVLTVPLFLKICPLHNCCLCLGAAVRPVYDVKIDIIRLYPLLESSNSIHMART